MGLKGVAPGTGDAEKVEALILGELARLAEVGFEQSAIEAAVNTTEFSLRENNTGSFPRGLSLMLRAAPAWLYGRDPLRPLKWADDLEAFKAKLASGEDPFRPLLRKFLLDNKHRVSVVLRPDASLGAEQEAAEQARVDAAARELGPEGLKAVAAETEALRERQETPDTPEALACVPSLALSDIPREAPDVPTAISELSVSSSSSSSSSAAPAKAKLLSHELFTNDVLYLDALLPMRAIPARLLPLVPLFCRSLTQMGTRDQTFVELTDRIGRKTGGFSVSPSVSDVRGRPDAPAAFVVLSGKAMRSQAGDLLSLASDVLLTARLDDRERFRQMALETKAGLEAGVVGAGHRFAARRLDAQRSRAGWAQEAMGGLSYLVFIRELVARVDGDWDGVKADLESIRAALLVGAAQGGQDGNGAIINATADGRTLDASSGHISTFLDSIVSSASSSSSSSSSGLTFPGDFDWPTGSPLRSEALTVPTQVNYVGKAANLYEDAGYKLEGSAYVANKLLGTSWLWDRVRVSGGAYGGFSDFDTHSGMFAYLSYRDPNLLETVDVYDQTPEWLRTLELDSDALTKAIIGTIGDIDGYQLPDAKGYTALTRHVLGVTREERQRRREEILGTTLKDVRAFADAIECVRSGKSARVVAVTSAERAAQAMEKRPGVFDEVIKVL